MTNTDHREHTQTSGCDFRRGPRALNAALATALSLSLGFGSGAPAWAVAEKDASATASSAAIEQPRDGADGADEASAADGNAVGDSDSPSGSEAAGDASVSGGRSSSAGSDEAGALGSDEASSDASSDGAASIEAASPEQAAEPRAAGEADASLRAGETDLGALWSGQAGGTDSPLTITSGGTYRLTEDLTVNSALDIKAPGADVVIDVGSFTLTSVAEQAAYLIHASSCASLTIVGDCAPDARDASKERSDGDSEDGSPKGRLVMAGATISHAVESSADALTVRNVSMHLKTDDDHVDVRSFDAAGIAASRGTVTVEQCRIVIDYSNQTALNTVSQGLTGCPRGLFFDRDVESALVSDTEIEVTGSTAIEPLAEKQSLTSSDNAYCLYSATAGRITVAGGDFAATSAHGTATALYGGSLALEAGSDGAPIAIEVDAGTLAAGVRTGSVRGALLDGPVEFAFPEALLPAYCAALVSDVENGFVLGPRFSASSATVLVGSSLAAANADAARIATFDASVDDGVRQTMSGMLVSGLEGGACSVRLDAEGLYFQLDPEKAPAAVVSESGAEELFASVGEALSAVRSGQTVKLLQDAGDLAFSRGSARNAFSIDLNGCTVRSLDISSRAAVRVYSSADERGGIVGFSRDLGGAFSYGGSGSLEVSGVDITCISRASEVTAFSCAGDGDVTFDDVNVRAVSQTSAAYGIRCTSAGSSLVLRDSSVFATADEPGVAAYGVVSSGANGALTIDGCSIEATSAAGNTGGIDVRGTLDLKNSTVEANAGRAGTTVWAVRATSGSAKVSVEASSLGATCDESPSSGSYWCLMAGAAVPANAASWTLDGACSFESAAETHIGFSETPVTVGGSFSATSRVVVYGADLEGDVAFVPEEGASLAGLAGAFSPYSESSYEGCTLRATDEGSLQWSGRATAQIVETGEQYRTFAEALAAAEAGQTVRLTSDCTVKETLSAKVPVTLDLNGRELSVRLSSDRLGASASALDFDCSGICAIVNGTVDVAMEAGSASVARDARFSAVSLGTNASLALDDTVVRLEFSSSVSGAGETAVVGVDAGSGAISVTDGSRVDVSVSGVQAASAVGIDVTGDAGAALIERGCTVAVDNRAQTQRQGSVTCAPSTTNLGSANLMRVRLEEGTELYEEIQRKFKEAALLDVQGDTEGYAYGTRMYYAAPIALDDGTYVWAFSDPLSAVASYDLEDVKASYFYFQSRYDVVPDACGVAYGDAGAVLRIDGSVSASSEEGNAFALRADGDDGGPSNAAASVSATARLSAHGGTQPYRSLRGSFDLCEELGPKLAGRSKVTYPTTGSYRLVETMLPETAAIGGTAASSVDVATGASLSATGGDGSKVDVTMPPENYAEDVTVTFANLRDASGRLLSDRSRTQAFGTALGEGGALPAAPDYERNGVTYRFIGWSVGSSSAGSRIWNPDRIEEGMTLDAATVGTAVGITLTAAYAPVGEGEHLVVFEIDDCVEACSVADGQSPSFRDAQRGASSSVPSKYERASGMTYGFTGWTSADGSALYAGALPRAVDDCRYVACFTETPTMLDATFYTWKEVGGTLAYASTVKEVACGASLDAEAGKLATCGDVVYGETQVYEFLGWSPRRSDAQPLYTDELPAQKVVTMVGSGTGVASRLYGIYRTRERLVDVIFVVDGATYATAEGVATSRTVNGAFSETGAQRPADKDETNRFRGWALGSADGTLLMGAVKTLADLTEGENDIVLYAVFGAGQSGDEQDDEGNGGALDGGSSGDAPGSGASSDGREPSFRSEGAPVASFGSTASTRAARADGSLAPMLRADDGQASAASAEEAAAFVREVPESAGRESASEGVMTEPTEEGRMGNTVAFFAGIAALAGAGLWTAWRAWRNRRLDEEDDFYEPEELGDKGEQVTF